MGRDTKKLLLDTGFKLFYEKGYQGCSISNILDAVNINKGSMYHYFSSKKALGLAVAEYKMAEFIEQRYFEILRHDAPFQALFKSFKDAPFELPFGCPLHKLTQEMALIDSDFKEPLAKVYKKFEYIVEQIIEKAIEIDEIEPCDIRFTAKSIISFYEGALVVVSLTNDIQQYNHLLSTIEESFI